MGTSQKEHWYIDYNDYFKVLDKHKSTIIYPYEEHYLDNIMPFLRTKIHDLNKNEDIIKKYFRLLRNDQIFSYSALKKNYCKYINIWLNKEYRDNNHHKRIPNFDFFKTFISKLNYEIYKNKTTTCENYINHLDTETISKIDFLHSLYEEYNKIKSPRITDLNNTCSKIDLLAKNYRESIYKYYDKDKDLYNKLEKIKELIDKITGNDNSPCKKKIYFTKPTELEHILEEQARTEAEEREKEIRQKEAARKAEEEAKKLQTEKDLEQQKLLQPKNLLTTSRDNQLQELHHDKGHFHSTSYREQLPELVTSRLPRPTQSFESFVRQESSTGSLLEEDLTKEDMGQGEILYEQRGRDKTRSGTFLGSLGFPGYITEVLGSVDPVPVVGVSGGMGALFLLFRYTPVGAFFRGGRGRVHRIPRSFNGQFLGGFPGYEDYEGGYIGYGPMNPLAE
ncbi:variable surface protein Vir6, putative [Plasmodium vivax]|uniref:Variable surface protein Vir6, putative n=1 Tax=Plasmodium vivax (strain Salvador I) TaxID=126793 RepID=A5KDP8_PLAVS|nr:variable surface protein Vir6, putative [Plasmodium vivax]EDL42521.1 variable surface protein Vir6, putative [Plasmodium vivax]|eukprot:XP_001608545.1 variable surface protein Vir6 [Plasmodium vivax Sal-1]